MWTLAFGHHEDRTPMHGYAETARPRWRNSLRAGGGYDLNDVRFRGKADIRCRLTLMARGANDAVDGAHSAASKCHGVVASKRTT
jgi:hypothetical protein